MKNFIGSIYKSNNFGDFVIIDDLGYNNKDKLFKIKFINTGTECIASYEAVRHGRVKDKYAPFVAGVGYVGSFEGKVTDIYSYELYKTWNDMLNRCYNINDRDYINYGALGITVDYNWFDFGNFFNDVKLLENYNYKVLYPNIYQLDKDYKQIHLPKHQRIYSRYTCIWISNYDNKMIMNIDQAYQNNKYPGVIYNDNGTYTMRYNNKKYGTYTNPIAASSAYYYQYNFNFNKYNNIKPPILFNQMPITETMNYILNPKELCTIIE